jgi:pimeloyl-ACP methyl ester carboxylesterase
MAAEAPTIVLVHGAWADATGFDAELRALRDRGYTAIGFANPLRDLAGDATYLADFLRTLTGPIVLVGHSYGGNVISMAAAGNDQVQALVYLNGWMCDEARANSSSWSGSKAAWWGLDPAGAVHRPRWERGHRPVPGPRGVPRRLRRRRRPRDGRGDGRGPAALCRRRVRGRAVGSAGVEDPAVLVLLGTQDKAIPAALQRFMAERANATIVEVAASHVSFLSQPEAATQLILQAVEATSRSQP